MKRGIDKLYYITHIDNIDSILQLGILSHKIIEEQKVRYTPVYDKKIILNRKDRKTPDGKSLWDYANLYFQARNPMLYRVLDEQSADKIAIIGIDLEVLDLPGVFVTNGNAASFSSTIHPANEYKKIMSELESVLNTQYWKDEDGSKRKIMAECLIPDKVLSDYIKEIYVVDDKTADKIKQLISSARVKKPGFLEKISSFYYIKPFIRSSHKQSISNEISVIPEPKIFFKNPLVVQLTPNLSVFKGDMFFSRMNTLTVSVNTVGVMGKGLASRAKYQFPDVYVLYQDLCRKKILRMGQPYLYKREAFLDVQLADEPMFPLKNGNGQTWFLLFPTKNHWRENADFKGIEQGMQWLKENYKKEQIKSISIPALGCGLGQLNWKDVGPMLCKYLASFDIPVQLYLPAERQVNELWLKEEFLLPKEEN